MAKKRTKTPENHKIAEQLLGLIVPIDLLKPDPLNARKHGKKDLAATQKSLDEFGQLKPIVVRKESMHVVAGNGTLQCAKNLGWTHIAAVVRPMTEQVARQFAIVDNRTAELSEWDEITLLTQISQFQNEDPGFADVLQLADLLPSPEKPAIDVPTVHGVAAECESEEHQKLVWQVLTRFDPKDLARLAEKYPKQHVKLVTM